MAKRKKAKKARKAKSRAPKRQTIKIAPIRTALKARIKEAERALKVPGRDPKSKRDATKRLSGMKKALKLLNGGPCPNIFNLVIS